jgi:hypothetical protein
MIVMMEKCVFILSKVLALLDSKGLVIGVASNNNYPPTCSSVFTHKRWQKKRLIISQMFLKSSQVIHLVPRVHLL